MGQFIKGDVVVIPFPFSDLEAEGVTTSQEKDAQQ